MMMLPNHLSASMLADRLKRGETSALDLMNACLDRIAAREPEVKAWAFLDAEWAREQAWHADEHRASGGPLGVLHGLPVGVKDVFDTADMPSEYGSEVLRGRDGDLLRVAGWLENAALSNQARGSAGGLEG